MNNKEIPFGITPTKTGEEEVKFDEIHNDFSSTEHGNTLASNVRYERYKPGNVTNAEWEKLLGADVNNLKHLDLTYELTRLFIRDLSEPLTKEEQEDLLLTAIVHDWAEAIVGDHSYDLKTKSVESTELEELKKMTAGVLSGNNDELISRIHHVTDTIIKDTTTKLGKIFNAVERVGYMRTALRSWRQSKMATEELKSGLEWLTNNVFLNQISKLISLADTYPNIAIYLKENKDLITDAFDNLPDAIFLKYKPEEVEEKTKQFKDAQKKWEEYSSKIS